MTYKLAIFDMDGTILNTLEDLTDSINYALAHFNYPTHTIDEVRSFVGNGLAVLVDRAVPARTGEAAKKEVFDVFNSYYNLHSADKTKPYDGIIDLIKELRNAGVKTAVVSNKQHQSVLDLCSKYFDGLFDIALGDRPDVNRKPAPDSVWAIINELSLNREDTVYIGDSEVDIATANNSGIDSIIVEWGFRKKDFLINHGAKTIVSAHSEIIKLIV